MTVLAVCADKGGVGKTTTTRNLGCEAARRGFRVLLVDADKQADLTKHMGVRPRPGEGMDAIMVGPKEDVPDARHLIRSVAERLDLLGSHENLYDADELLALRIRREHALGDALHSVVNDYDLIMVDVGHSKLVTQNALAIADLLLVPTTPDHTDAMHIGKMLSEAALVRRQLGLPILDAIGRAVISIWRHAQKAGLEEEGIRQIREHYGAMVSPAIIPETMKVREANTMNLSVREYRDGYVRKRERAVVDAVVSAYEQLLDYVVMRLPARLAS